MCRCLGNTFLTVLTLSTIGVVTLAIAGLFVVVRVKHLYLVSDAVNIGLIVALSVSGVILILAIAGSCCGGKCLRTFLAIVYILFAVGVAIIGILFATNRDSLVSDLAHLWTDDKDDAPAKLLEGGFNCTCFNTTNATCIGNNSAPTDVNDTCSVKIQHVIDITWKWVLWVSIGLAGLLVITAILALLCAHCCDDEQHGAGAIRYGPQSYTLMGP
jgi:hypothetical protein